MSDSSDSPDPQVRVTLPGGRVTTGRLRRWRQDQTGAWLADVALSVPAAAVQQIDGEDYSTVEREPTEPRYVLSTDTRLKPPTLELHLATCWTLAKPATGTRITPVPDPGQARGMLTFDDTTACEVCRPKP